MGRVYKFNPLHIIFPLFVFCSIIVSCSNGSDVTDEPDDEPVLIEDKTNPNPMEAYSPLGNKEDGLTQNILGYGYDVMGVAGGEESVKAPILDLNTISVDRISIMRVLSSYSINLYAENSADFTKEIPFFFLDNSLKEQEELKGKVLQAKTLSTCKTLLGMDDEYSFRSSHTYYLRNRYSLLPLWLDELFSESFSSDLNTLTATELIKKYGTHIITEFYDGTRFDIFYMAKIHPLEYQYKDGVVVLEPDNDKAMEAGFNNAMIETESSSLSWGSSPSDWETLLKTNINPILFMNAVGGGKDLVPSGFYNLEKGFPKSNQKEWYKTVDNVTDDSLFELVKIQCLSPIYKWIKDPEKKEEVRKAVLAYMDSAIGKS